ncbi:lipocalin-like domain-containing protein [Streptomyces massasporeus]|uniref:lipocalin-like domain-containing protein n=1 Tax=Streptomyces massasporeus TaxID=67324 RepID=UPI00340D194B
MADDTSDAPHPADLVGTWELVAFRELDDEGGGTSDGPLGPDAGGLLIYAPDGAVSVSMMRRESRYPGAPGPTGGQPRTTAYMGYAGTWRLEGTRLSHHVEVSTHTYQLGQDLEREVRLRGDRLDLIGRAPVDGRYRRRMLTWRRRAPGSAGGIPNAPRSTGGSG